MNIDDIENTETEEVYEEPEQTEEAFNGAEETPQEAYERFMLKVNGEEQEVVYKDRDELLRDIQKGRAADQKFQESAKIRQEYEELVGGLRSQETFIDTLYRLGYTDEQIDAMAESRVESVLEDRLYPEAAERKRELAELERYRKEQEEREHENEMALWDNRIRTAMAASPHLPDNPVLIRIFYKEVAEVMEDQYNQGNRVSAEDVIRIVGQQFDALKPKPTRKLPPRVRPSGKTGRLTGQSSKNKRLSIKDL